MRGHTHSGIHSMLTEGVRLEEGTAEGGGGGEGGAEGGEG